jgi:hypothetical protein
MNTYPVRVTCRCRLNGEPAEVGTTHDLPAHVALDLINANRGELVNPG